MPKKDLTVGSKILLFCLAAGDLAHPIISRREMYKRLNYTRSNTLDVTLNRLITKGWIKYTDKEGERFIKLTKNGEIQALLAKARMPTPEEWDGKWRMIFFDIPEVAKEKRNLLRGLLKKNNYHKLQNSAYVNPYPLNREAISYLKETNLIQFIRIAKVEELDDDGDLRRKFKLK